MSQEESEKCGIPLNGTIQAEEHVRKPFYKLKVMGGTDAKFGQHPWAVAILLHDYPQKFSA
uniref:Uncharacterized protein n=1 Tax=Setaria digitata TaxID=48799 RepID=A0A915Q4W9_9BILA